MQALLADGTPFTLGMPVVMSPTGEEVATNATGFELTEETYGGRTFAILSRKGGFGGISTDLLYPSRQAWRESLIRRLKALKGRIDGEIASLEAGGDPADCEVLNMIA